MVTSRLPHFSLLIFLHFGSRVVRTYHASRSAATKLIYPRNENTHECVVFH